MSLLLLFLAACVKHPPLMDAVNFNTGTTDFAAPGDEAVIDRAVNVLKNTEFDALVIGMADSTGDTELNKKLSLERAGHVAKLLRERANVGEKRIKIAGMGEQLAIGGDELSERKVEIIFYTDKGQTIPEIVKESRALRNDIKRKRASKE